MLIQTKLRWVAHAYQSDTTGCVFNDTGAVCSSIYFHYLFAFKRLFQVGRSRNDPLTLACTLLNKKIFPSCQRQSIGLVMVNGFISTQSHSFFSRCQFNCIFLRDPVCVDTRQAPIQSAMTTYNSKSTIYVKIPISTHTYPRRTP